MAAEPIASSANGRGPGPRREARDGFLHVRVGGPPEEMGAQHGELLRSEIQYLLAALDHHVLHGRPRVLGWLTRRAMRATARLMELRIPFRYRREMASLAQAAQVPYQDILLLNCLDDILANLWVPGAFFARWACSGFATWGQRTPSGDLLCGRNLDYYVWSAKGEDPWAATSYMKEHVVAITHEPSEGSAFVSVGWPGFVGAATALSELGISISALSVPIRRNWPLATPAPFLYRDVMEAATTLEEAVAILRRGPRSQGNNVLLGSGAEARAVVVEFTPWDFVVREGADGAIAATNHFLHPDTAPLAARYVLPDSTARLARLQQISSQLSGPDEAGQCLLDLEPSAVEAGNSWTIYNSCTIYSVIFAPAQGRLWLRTADQPRRSFQEVTLVQRRVNS